jgi:hypothetical protein
MNVIVGIFKDTSLMGIFLLPPMSPTANIATINMISSFTSRSIISVDPWVVPHSKDVESSRASMSLTAFEIVNPTIPSTSIDTSQQLHHHMECHQPTPPVRFFDSLCSHDILDFELPSEEAILEVMASIENPKDEVMHQSYFIDLEPMKVIMMSFNLGMGAFVGASNTLPILIIFYLRYIFQNLPLIYFPSLPSKICVLYLLHVLMGPIMELS